MDLEEVSARDLLKQYARILDELRGRRVISTRDSPVGGYGQWLICRALTASPQRNSFKGVDAITPDGVRLQIKTRWLAHSGDSRQLSAIRNLGEGLFDFVAAVLLDREFGVQEAYLIPHESVVRFSRVVSHTNSNRLVLSPQVCADSSTEDITAKVREADPDEPRSGFQAFPSTSVNRAPGPVHDEADRGGIIVDISGLTARQVVHRRVLCPACGVKVFESWPEGWDAHAAHRCLGISGVDPEARKEEFKSRFRQLFL